VQVWLEAVRLLVRHFGPEVFVRGNCDQAPFSLASMLRGAADWMMDLMDEGNRERAERLLDHCAEAGLQFVRLMAGTGATWFPAGTAGRAGPRLAAPLPLVRAALGEAAGRRGAPARPSLHAPHLRSDRPDPRGHAGDGGRRAGARLQDRRPIRPRPDEGPATFIGNLDPSGVLALGTPALVEAKTRELLAVFADTPHFVLNAGCAIPATTPGENLRAMIRAARVSRLRRAAARALAGVERALRRGLEL